MMSGQYQYREIARFLNINSDFIHKRFAIKVKFTPSHVTISKILKDLDFNELKNAMNKWFEDNLFLQKGDWISIDGKSIRSTVSETFNSNQNFVSLVSMFSQRLESVIFVDKFENKKMSEIEVASTMIDLFTSENLGFTLDALHCKKKL